MSAWHEVRNAAIKLAGGNAAYHDLDTAERGYWIKQAQSIADADAAMLKTGKTQIFKLQSVRNAHVAPEPVEMEFSLLLGGMAPKVRHP